MNDECACLRVWASVWIWWRYIHTLSLNFTVSRPALGAHILEICSKDGLHQWIRSDSSIGEVCIWRASLADDTLYHFRCGWSLHHDTSARCLRSVDAILSTTFTSWSDWHTIDQWYHANGSSGVRHQLFCVPRQVLSTDSRWGHGIGVHHDISEHLHVGMGTVLGRTSTCMRWTLWPVSTVLFSCE